MKLARHLPLLGEAMDAMRNFNDAPTPSIAGSSGGKTVFGGDVPPDVPPFA
jgi:hypothetical protein